MRFKEVAEYFDSIEKVASRNKMVSILADLINKSSMEEVKILSYLIQGQIDAPFKSVKFNIAEKLCIKAIGNAYGASGAKVSAKYGKLGDLGLVAESLSRGRGKYSVKEVDAALEN